MEAWILWLICGIVGLISILYLGFIGYDLMTKASRVAKELEIGVARLEQLTSAIEQAPEIDTFDGNLLDNPAVLAENHSRNLKQREAKRQLRQRRLIERLNQLGKGEL